MEQPLDLNDDPGVMLDQPDEMFEEYRSHHSQEGGLDYPIDDTIDVHSQMHSYGAMEDFQQNEFVPPPVEMFECEMQTDDVCIMSPEEDL